MSTEYLKKSWVQFLLYRPLIIITDRKFRLISKIDRKPKSFIKKIKIYLNFVNINKIW